MKQHKTIRIADPHRAVELLGPRDAHLRILRDAFDVQIIARGDTMTVRGDQEPVEACLNVIAQMEQRMAAHRPLTPGVVAALAESPDGESHDERSPERTGRLESGGPVRHRIPSPKTQTQARYIEAIFNHDIVFCIGPAGTGKTYLAVAVALDYLARGELKRIVLCRPAVEAGEHLGYLPGDLRSKVNPYLRPLYDALHDFISRATLEEYIERDLVEILPLAFVRGRTLDNAFIILDEAQNCTVGQMKTFLTRLGCSAKLVATGDITQVDLPHEMQSGLIDVQGRLEGIEGVAFARLSEQDIVRHRLVKQIVTAYQRESVREPGRGSG